jgi:hypothetical protein
VLLTVNTEEDFHGKTELEIKKTGDDLLSRPSHRNSTISAGGLNFSVRNGKRCCPTAIVTSRLDFVARDLQRKEENNSAKRFLFFLQLSAFYALRIINSFKY